MFWFVADNEQTTGNVQLQCYLVKDLLLHRALQRWAYISCFPVCAPGQEDARLSAWKINRRLGAGISVASHPNVDG